MGYYTRFELEAIGDYKILEILKEMKSLEFYPFNYGIDNMLESNILELNDESVTMLYLEAGDEAKWYEHEDNMKELSLKFPEVLFKLHGEGEESGDIWDKYFKNGKIQICSAEIVIPPFDESKLK